MVETQNEKLHTACDECRTRKLKCSGELPQCSRCEREGIRCVYSPQKQMGRPRKRRRDDVGTPAERFSEDHSNISRSNFSDLELISPPEFNDLSGFSDIQENGIVNSLVPHDDSTLANVYTQGLTSEFGFGINPMIDPSLWNATATSPKFDSPIALELNQPAEAPCTCLSIMYLTLTDLQTMTSFAFPGVVPTLRQAINTASLIMQCEKCPKEPFSAIQNVMTLSSLLSALAARFHKVLHEIDIEADRLERTGEKKPFRIGDTNPALQHLHTGTPDCPMSFNIELEAKDWRQLAKKALKTEVLGGGSNPTPLSTLLDQMEARQRRWHTDNTNHEERARIFGSQNMCSAKGNDATCLRMVNQVRGMVANMVWE
ncbi:hypothetical protein K469DRAFT_658388 [Zopfia rhizophila CBS 207.26]|uniref:Zn(2)-C6 fungal-type domain-containing protein n=1 Tax=Zopfia rhizophila CBS 207.26 TaxID=1314779 RepID=A0A6A6EFS7_9PEZI|nr:hypothetical protein K469DRAFT_658388 [Zopfia rhizophila CBS 207.26]